jgi:hypothetical protein
MQRQFLARIGCMHLWHLGWYWIDWPNNFLRVPYLSSSPLFCNLHINLGCFNNELLEKLFKDFQILHLHTKYSYIELSYATSLGLMCLSSLPLGVKFGFGMASVIMFYDQICIVGEGGNQRKIHNWDVSLCGHYGWKRIVLGHSKLQCR